MKKALRLLPTLSLCAALLLGAAAARAQAGGALPLPAITRIEGTNLFSLATTAPNAVVRYTIGVAQPQNPTARSATYEGIPLSLVYDTAAVGATQCTVTVKAVTEQYGRLSPVATQSMAVMLTATPQIAPGGADGRTVTLSFAPDALTPATAQLRYTLDGTAPTAASAPYSAPFQAEAGQWVTAALFDGCHQPGNAASAMAGKSGLFPNDRAGGGGGQRRRAAGL